MQYILLCGEFYYIRKYFYGACLVREKISSLKFHLFTLHVTEFLQQFSWSEKLSTQVQRPEVIFFYFLKQKEAIDKDSE